MNSQRLYAVFFELKKNKNQKKKEDKKKTRNSLSLSFFFVALFILDNLHQSAPVSNNILSYVVIQEIECR